MGFYYLCVIKPWLLGDPRIFKIETLRIKLNPKVRILMPEVAFNLDLTLRSSKIKKNMAINNSLLYF